MSESEERFRAILEHAPVMIDAFEPDGSVVIWNRECERRLGYSAEEIEAMEDPLATCYPDPEKRAEVIAAIERADGKFREYEVLAKDGSVRLQRWADFKLPNASTISVGYDVTEQRKLEASLQQAQKLQAVGTLSAGIAHDFNNLLTIIGCSAVLAQKHVQSAEGVPELVDRSLTDVLEATERGVDLIRRLMTFSRRDGLRRRPVVFDEVLSTFVPTLRRVLPESLELAVVLGASGALVMADPVAIEQVLLNLVTNARDATDGHGSISLETSLSEGEVVLVVQDSGSGMAPEAQKRAFEPFFTTKEPGKGTGLGLPMAYGLVGQHEGTIEVTSELGQGTRVEVRVPVRMVAHPVPPAEPPASRQSQGETILVVEDDRNVSNVASRCLQQAGYVVLTAADGVEALATLAEQPAIDLVLSDVVMPNMGGAELGRRIREGPYAGVPIVFMSGYSPDLSDDERLLPKPWTPTQLAAFVGECLEARGARSRRRA